MDWAVYVAWMKLNEQADFCVLLFYKERRFKINGLKICSILFFVLFWFVNFNPYSFWIFVLLFYNQDWPNLLSFLLFLCCWCFYLICNYECLTFVIHLMTLWWWWFIKYEILKFLKNYFRSFKLTKFVYTKLIKFWES